jgi:glutaredoxin 3
MKLYVKVWCPWCVAAREWLDSRGYRYDVIDVEEKDTAYAEMRKLSGQNKTPTLVTDDGKVLPDFGPDELAEFVKEHGLSP